jgi:hypothetical protein
LGDVESVRIAVPVPSNVVVPVPLAKRPLDPIVTFPARKRDDDDALRVPYVTDSAPFTSNVPPSVHVAVPLP